MIRKFLFPEYSKRVWPSLILLAFRILFGILMMIHGYQKFAQFNSMKENFPDPIGVGSEFSLALAIFGELICSAAFVVGLLYRLTMIPMLITMGVAFFIIHGNDPFANKELAFVYLAVFVIMYLAGPGRFAIDSIINEMFIKDKREKARSLQLD
ncbi:MAG: DoxX family protein [Bacteroidales bacterium]|nr:DoxX family protein [Bacteroidales bacterium]MDD4821338.1 DoxX family protein [Bacteroidales bacterium]